MLQAVLFWLEIFKEHALFIKLGLPAGRTDLRDEAQMLMVSLQRLEDEARQSSSLTPALKRKVQQAVVALLYFKNKILRLLIQCQLEGATLYPLLVNHTIREAKYFLQFLKCPPRGNHTTVLKICVFWVRIMKEHLSFLHHFLDPTEKQLMRQVMNYHRTFCQLQDTGDNLLSMARSNPSSFNRVERYYEQVKTEVAKLRDFKYSAYQLAKKCQMLNAAPSPLLVEHVYEEAKRFLQELDYLTR